MPSVWMCPLLAFEWFNGSYSYLVFRTLSIIRKCPVNMNFLAQKIRALQMCPNTKWPFYQRWLIWFWLHYTNLWRLITSIKLHRWHLQENNGPHTRVTNDYTMLTCPNLYRP
jgi:hypothetical protein